jgi:hypothetical protein
VAPAVRRPEDGGGEAGVVHGALSPLVRHHWAASSRRADQFLPDVWRFRHHPVTSRRRSERSVGLAGGWGLALQSLEPIGLKTPIQRSDAEILVRIPDNLKGEST